MKGTEVGGVGGRYLIGRRDDRMEYSLVSNNLFFGGC